ncbi:helix-turn-helix domain-containing protein [Rugamonas apoptosis]|uniref:Helix-turn-helix transcriptional regulator n=1 Tax=Rugamonas apoptosis TaxID=2758570 RepID=A0A7W2F9M4_9BURK|nr:XRE family transcriptional regulator [Rugamonas apoptosis]MBA5687685.1 helix-turn-helix transcriptional regulator [Rugamonas apoptosis]
MKTPVPTNAPPEVGAALQRLRLARGLTLEDLSRIAGVSKSMLSQIEREKANPTIAITWRLANALGVQIGELLANVDNKDADTIRVVDAHETPTLPGQHAGYVLRILGPMELAGKYEWYELTLAPGGELVSQPHDPGASEHLTLLHGAVEVEAGAHKKKVKLGGTARYPADVPHAIRNAGKTEAKALLVVIHR